MTNKQFFIAEMKNMLRRDDLSDSERVRLLAKPIPAPRRRKRRAAKPAAHMITPFKRPA